MKNILTSKNEEIFVDDDDYDWVIEYVWYIDSKGYAFTHIDKKFCLMHRMIANAEDHECVDHINHCKLDNTKINLRKCSKQQNSFNRLKLDNTTSKYKGVYIGKDEHIRMQIKRDGKRIHHIYFTNELSAAACYDYYAKELFGEFAILNGIDIPKEEWEKDIITLGSNPKSSSGYRGISLEKRTGKWVARLHYQGMNYHIGTFDTEEEAYDNYVRFKDNLRGKSNDSNT